MKDNDWRWAAISAVGLLSLTYWTITDNFEKGMFVSFLTMQILLVNLVLIETLTLLVNKNKKCRKKIEQ